MTTTVVLTLESEFLAVAYGSSTPVQSETETKTLSTDRRQYSMTAAAPTGGSAQVG